MELVFENVSKRIHRSEVIRDISFHWHSGTVYGLCGYNGSGKTMLMRLASGLLRPTHGQIKINGQVLGKDIDFPPQTGLLLENPSFLNPYTGKRNLQLIAAIQNKAQDTDIEESLSSVGLTPNDPRKYKKYSLGMKQRLGIAAAVMEKPDLILLDEPTNALDADGMERLTNLVLLNKERGALIVVASHDHDFLTCVSDYIYTIEHGEIVHVSSTEVEN